MDISPYIKLVNNLFCVCVGDTAYSLGTAMDELMRHQPTLKPDAMKAIVKVRDGSSLIEQ